MTCTRGEGKHHKKTNIFEDHNIRGHVSSVSAHHDVSAQQNSPNEFILRDIMSSEKQADARTEKRTSQWEDLMRKFSEAHKEECKTASLDIPRAPRSIKQFPTGSKYEGTWDLLGMSGFGTYTFPNGVIYCGEFEDGTFQGTGELRYPEGAILKGTWNKGHMVERKLVFADGLEYSEEDWKYCRMPDRRFTVEYENGLQPGGKSYLTADQPTKEIPQGYYDTGDGFYDPVTKIVYKQDDITCIVRSPCTLEQKWIVDNCRTSPDLAVGPRPDLYEEWSEPQLQPEKPPPPAAATRTTNAVTTELDKEHDRGRRKIRRRKEKPLAAEAESKKREKLMEIDDTYYETLRKTRSMCVSSNLYSDHPLTRLFRCSPSIASMASSRTPFRPSIDTTITVSSPQSST